MPDEPIPPPPDINVPPADYKQAGQLEAEGTKDSGLPERLVAAFIFGLVRLLKPLISIYVDAMDEILSALGQLFLAGQGEGSHGFTLLTATVLGDLLGFEINGEQFFADFQSRGRLKAMEDVGSKLVDTLTDEFGSQAGLSPDQGVSAAKTFLGFVLSFAVRQGNVAFLTSLLPEDIRFGDQFREYGEMMAKNLGLGRLTRMVLKPLLTTMVATPYQWKLHQLFHPTQFTIGDVVNPFQQTLMDHDTIFKALDLLGYTDDKKEQLIKLHQKRLTFDDVDLLLRWQIYTPDQAHDAITHLGYPEELATLVLYLVGLRKAEGAVNSLVDAIEASTVEGHTTIDEFSALLDSLPIDVQTKKFRLQAVQYKTKATRAHVTLAQAQKAFEEGVWDLTQLEDYLTRRGYSADDAATLEALTLLALTKLDEAKKVAKFAYDKKVEKAKAKGTPIPPPPAILAT
jgi:hypothetical protein